MKPERYRGWEITRHADGTYSAMHGDINVLSGTLYARSLAMIKVMIDSRLGLEPD